MSPEIVKPGSGTSFLEKTYSTYGYVDFMRGSTWFNEPGGV